MAKASEMLQLRGKTNGIIFYKRANGGFSARSYSEGNYRKGAESVRSRENQVEFAGMASAIKSLSRFTEGISIPAYTRQLFRNKMWQRYKGQLLNNSGNATTPRGQRGAKFTLVDLSGEVVTTPISRWVVPQITHSLTSEGAFSVTIPALGADDVKAPEGATHYKFVHIAGIVSDYAFDADANEIVPLNPDGDGVFMVSLGDTKELGVATEAGTPKVVTLANDPMMDSIVLGALGIVFLQRVGGQDYMLEQEVPLQILDWVVADNM